MSILRRLLFVYAFLWLKFVLATPVNASNVIMGGNSNRCRCFPGELCWPMEHEWLGLNRSLAGKLVATVPIGSVCHTALFDAQKCADLQNVWHEPETHIQTSHSVMAPLWANASCDPFSLESGRCIVGTYTQYAVNATAVEDIQVTVRWARRRNIRLVVRNTGHDYIGKSTGAGGLGIWTKHLKSFEIRAYASPYYTGKAITFGAGIGIGEANRIAHTARLTVVGGNCPTVGLVGGYSQGGGYGYLTSKYGFGAQQVLEWNVVTTDGKIVRATPNVNSDLHWALSGGGGGTYGIVVSMTVRAYPEEQTIATNLTFSMDGVSADRYYNAVKAFQASLPALTRAGGASIYTLQETSFTLTASMGFGMTEEAMESILQPTFSRLDELSIPYQTSTFTFPSYFDAYQIIPPTPTSEFQAGNRVLPPSVLQLNPDGLIKTLRRVLSYGTVIGIVAYQAPESTLPNSVNPSFHSGMLSFTIGTVWSNTNWTLNLQNQALMTNTLLPSFNHLYNYQQPTAYLNEGDSQEPTWQGVFYGTNYNKLKQIKQKFDPDNILWGRTTVGSERLSERDDGRLCFNDVGS